MTADRALLALETSGKSGSVAVATLRGQGPLAIEQEVLDPEYGSARTLAPAIAGLLERLRLTPRMLHAIAVVQGPGSFTGLRVGAATAKTIGWALGIPLVAVDALDCVAHQVATSRTMADCDEPVSLMVVSDAYRSQVFRASYLWDASGLAVEEATEIEEIASVVKRLLSSAQKWILTGPGAGKLSRWLADASTLPETGHHPVHSRIQILQGSEALPRAATVAELGWSRWEKDEVQQAIGFLPKYYRGSAAEEKRNRPDAT